MSGLFRTLLRATPKNKSQPVQLEEFTAEWGKEGRIQSHARGNVCCVRWASHGPCPDLCPLLRVSSGGLASRPLGPRVVMVGC